MAMPSSTAMVLNSLATPPARSISRGDELAEVFQMDVAGHELGEGIGDGDDGFVEVPILHSGGAPEAAGAGHIAAMSGGSGAIMRHLNQDIRRVPREPLFGGDGSAAAFPTGFEQRQVVLLLVGMFLDLLDVEIDAQAGPLGDLDVAIHHFDGVGDDLLSQGSLNSSKISWMKKFGMEAFSWTHAAEQTGPCALWGAITPKCASTMSADFARGEKAAEVERLGLQDADHSCLSSSANCCLVERLSPVAMGTGLRRATSIMAGMLVCGTGSSNHAGRNWWMASANSTAVATLKRQWPSISRSTDRPTASRTARMMSTERSKS